MENLHKYNLEIKRRKSAEALIVKDHSSDFKSFITELIYKMPDMKLGQGVDIPLFNENYNCNENQKDIKHLRQTITSRANYYKVSLPKFGIFEINEDGERIAHIFIKRELRK